MSTTKDKMRLLMCSDDPETILSYGILSRMLIEKWYRYYDIHYCSLQKQLGKPEDIYQEDTKQFLYKKYPAHNHGERNPTYLPQVIQDVHPDLLWTNFDLQHYNNIAQFVPPGMTWIGWIPWDNHDAGQIQRANQAFQKVQVRVAISKFGSDFLNKNGCRIDDVIYNIVDTENYYPVKKDSKEAIDWKQKNKWYKEEEKVLLFVGRPNWRKRMLHLFAIIQELKRRGNKFKAIIHSNLNDPAKTANLYELIHALGINDKLVLRNFVFDQGITKADLRMLYNMADVYIAPHGGEGFGMPIGESMACGTPFIATDICTTPEFRGENNERGLGAPFEYPTDTNGRIIPDGGINRPLPKVHEFCDLIEGLWHDENRVKKMGENGVKWVNENCSNDVVSDKWRNVLDTFDIKFGAVTDYA